MEQTKKELRIAQAKRAMGNMIPHENGPALMDHPSSRISYLRGLKSIATADKIVLLLSDGNAYSGIQINNATAPGWCWNQRKNDTLPMYGFFTKTLEHHPNQNAAEYHYQANIYNKSAREMAYQYFNLLFDRLDRRLIMVDRKLIENLAHPDVKITPGQRNLIHYIRKQAGWDQDEYRATLKAWGDAESCKDMSKKMAQRFISKAKASIPNLNLEI